MGLDDTPNISHNYNTSADVVTAKLLDNYNLSNDQKEGAWKQIQEIRADRDQSIQVEENDYGKNLEDRQKSEFNRLKAEQTPGLEYNMENVGSHKKDATLYREAYINIQNNHEGRLESYEKESEKRENALLMQLKEQGQQQDQTRDNNQDQGLSQEFNRVR